MTARGSPRSQNSIPNSIPGRGVTAAPAGRFEQLHFEPEPDPDVFPYTDTDADEGGAAAPRTVYLRDVSRSALSKNRSPDIPFAVGLNPYRGCEHGCAYCYARPTHEYLGFSAGLDFETRILVKTGLGALLRRQLNARNWKPQVIAMSGVTDPYQPIERRLGLTRQCLQILAEHRNPVSLITKSRLVTRDLELLGELARYQAISVTLSITTLDRTLARTLEPRAAQPNARLLAVKALAEAGIPVGVNVAPVIPALNDHEIPAILEASARAGAGWANFVMLRLPQGMPELFRSWLDAHVPDRATHVMHRVEEMRGGAMNDSRFGHRMRGSGPCAKQTRDLFDLARRRAGLAERGPELSVRHFRRLGVGQLDLFAP